MNRTANRTTIRASAPESYAAVGFHMPLRRMLRRASATCGLLCAALAGAALAACAQAPQPQLREVFDRTVPLASGGSFALENVNGAVTVTGWDREAVEIRAVKTTSHAATDLLQVQIEVAAVPGRVAVDTVNPPDGGPEVNVAYSVRVPRRVLLQHVSTVNGTVRVTGVESAGTLRSVNGDIEVLDSAGGFSAHTTNGNIQMELARLTAIAPLSAETVNGSIAVALPNDASATLDVRSLNGVFRSTLPVTFLGAYSPRELHGKLGGGAVAVRLHTVNGSIRLLPLPQGL